jgi:two-component system, sensor histidine kinase YesM
LAEIFKDGTPSGGASLRIGKENYLVVYDTLPAVQWKLVVGVPQSDLLATRNEISNSILIALLISFIIILMANVLLSNQLARPISRLKLLMRKAAAGDFDVAADYNGKDEISELYNSFRVMVSQIKQLIERSLQEQNQTKSYELKYLQAQINPHFLHNTLESIVWVAEAGKTDEVVDLIIALSRFYKSVLNIDSDVISFSQVSEHVSNYLVIMKKRYHDILNYSFHIDDRVLPATFPKMALQPIVENAINHGIKNKPAGGRVDIDIRLNPQNMIEITISDDGIGMTEKTLRDLQSTLDKPAADNQPIGLWNINERIKLLFGRAYGLEITSQYGVGTTVKIAVPFIVPKDEAGHA